MGAVLAKSSGPISAAWHVMPSQIKVLYIANRRRTGAWLAEAFAADSVAEVVIEEAVGTAAGLARLRDEAFDAILVSHVPGELDALHLIEGYRAGGADEPIVVLGNESEQEMAAVCFESGADGYVCVNTTTTRTLIWLIARAIQRYHLIRDNQRLSRAERQRVQRDHDETDRLLAEQRAMIAELEGVRIRRSIPPGRVRAGKSRPARPSLAGSNPPAPHRVQPPDGFPSNLLGHYRELLRTYVIMGSGNLACELSRLADLLATAGVTAQQAMQLHLHVLEELVHGLGARSTRHVMTRADLLIMEIMIHLAEGYRKRYLERFRPPSQRLLPGFEEEAATAF